MTQAFDYDQKFQYISRRWAALGGGNVPIKYNSIEWTHRSEKCAIGNLIDWHLFGWRSAWLWLADALLLPMLSTFTTCIEIQYPIRRRYLIADPKTISHLNRAVFLLKKITPLKILLRSGLFIVAIIRNDSSIRTFKMANSNQRNRRRILYIGACFTALELSLSFTSTICLILIRISLNFAF